MNRIVSLIVSLIALAVLPVDPAKAADLTGGVMYAVPAPNGGPTIDGSLRDWDLSGAEPIWISAQTAAKLHGSVALMYDAKALYVAADVSLPGRPIANPAKPVDRYWDGDCLEFRLASDPTLPAPLNRNAEVMASDRIAHLTMWKNSVTGVDYVAIAYGVNLDKGSSVNPAGSKIVISQHKDGYTIEARIPWTALHVPNGDNPFVSGSRMTAVLGLLWASEGRTAALYRQNPGDFAFHQSQTWGQVEFSVHGHLAPHHPTMAQALAPTANKAVGVPIAVNVPTAGKVSVNIIGSQGQVIREITGGISHPKGKMTVYWDGYDQWGFPCAPGKYTWGAYVSQGLKAEYRGVFGKSGTPPYQTADAKGGWIGDHSELADVAADATGIYAMCPIAEAERSIIKLGYDDKTIWRRTPFVGGGWGPLYSIASNGKYLFATFGLKASKLVRLDAATGQTLVYTSMGDNVVMAPISESAGASAPEDSSPFGLQPDTSGLAASKTEVYASVFSANIIQVLDPESGKPTRQIPCPSPRGLALDRQGNLYAISYSPNGASKLLRFDRATGDPKVVIADGLVEPWHVALSQDGKLYISQEGASQQVVQYTVAGKRLGSVGKAGGRTWAGTYHTDALRNPAGLAVDERGRLIVAEAAIPRVLDRYLTSPLKFDRQWYGSGAYWNADFPDPDDPLTGYYPFEPSGFAKAKIVSTDIPGAPVASWDLNRAGYDALPDMYDRISSPEIKYLSNGKKYMYSDSMHGVCLVVGDQILPVGGALVHNARQKGNTLKKSYLEVWSDTNGNHRIDAGEEAMIDTVDGAPLPEMADATCSMWLNSNGDLYLTSEANKILRIPATGINAAGTIAWAADKATWCIGPIIPSKLDYVPTGWRNGILGLRIDSHGNYFTCYNAILPALTDDLAAKITKAQPNLPRDSWQAYATADLAKRYHEGLGHAGESNAVKIAKFDKAGRLLWVAGRKATAASAPGEMYHFWSLAGMINDDYVVGASELGQQYIYTKDGYYVDSLFNNPGLAPPPGPYTFGGETSGGRIQYFKKRGEVWTYCTGMAYLVHGFDKSGKVIGETRLTGAVKLDRVYDTAGTAGADKPEFTIVGMPASGDWSKVPASSLKRSSAVLATAQAAYDATTLHVRIHVADPTPLQNGADDVTLAFKGGDAVGIDLGPAGDRNAPSAGDIRILAARIGGANHLIGMKPVSATKRPQEYFTPAGGRKHFDYVGEIPGGRATLTADRDGKGYTADLSIPRAFVDIAFAPGTKVKADIEVLLSGQGGRGLQAISRNYLFTPPTAQTTMTDDIPTESWLYPQYWGDVAVK